MINDRNTKINVFIIMINEQILKEKLKYLITMDSSKWFDIMDVYIEFDYTSQSHDKLFGYDLDVKFDYHGVLDFDLESLVYGIQKMSDELQKILTEYVITQDGKIVQGDKSDCYATGPMVYNIEYEADTKHIFTLGYKFRYTEED